MCLAKPLDFAFECTLTTKTRSAQRDGIAAKEHKERKKIRLRAIAEDAKPQNLDTIRGSVSPSVNFVIFCANCFICEPPCWS
jgi:hypothetical protein